MNTVTKHIVTAKAIIAREKELCQHIDAAIEEWSKQAQQTQQYMKALEYVKTPPTPHTSNRWTVSEYGNHEMSNMVYRFSWREYEHTEWDRTLKNLFRNDGNSHGRSHSTHHITRTIPVMAGK